MRFPIVSATAMALALCAPGSLAAQTFTIETSVTFLLPVNLTQLSPDIERVKVICMISSPALTPTGLPPGAPFPIIASEALVSSGQVNTTLRTEFPIYSGWLVDAIGKQAVYQCGLQGYKKSTQHWDFFDEASADPVFRLKPTPPGLQGSFVW
jgi:hypothetical protein